MFLILEVKQQVLNEFFFYTKLAMLAHREEYNEHN